MSRVNRRALAAAGGGAASFNGTVPSYLQAASSSDFQVAGHDFSLVLWYQIPALPSAYEKLITKGNNTIAGDDWGLQINGSNNNLTLYFSDGSAYHSQDLGLAVGDGNWHFVYAGWNQASQIFEWGRDGAAITSGGGGNFSPQATANPIQFGAAGDGSGFPFTGQLDAPAFWRRRLTSGEMQQLYNGGAGIKMASLSGSLLTGIGDAWDLDGPGGDGLWHSVVNGHALTAHSVAIAAGKT